MIDRYTRKEMGEVWQLHNRFQKMLAVEVAVAKVQASLGIIPAVAAKEIEKKGKLEFPLAAMLQRTWERTADMYTLV